MSRVTAPPQPIRASPAGRANGKALGRVGQPIEANTRRELESRFGHEFDAIRVHSDDDAAHAAKSIGALAFTVGRDIYFGAGHYAPTTVRGRHLLAHELAHAVQQSRGGAGAPPRPGSTPEQDADRAAAAAVTGWSPVRVRTTTGLTLARQAETPSPAHGSPELVGRPAGRYVDDFASATYDLDYRGEPRGALSRWLQLTYQDGTRVDIHIDQVIDEETTPEEGENLKRRGYVGAGARIFPARMNGTTTPRLSATKQQVLQIMDDYNATFILGGAFTAVWIIITEAATGGLVRVPTLKATRIPQRSFAPGRESTTGTAPPRPGATTSTAPPRPGATTSTAQPQPGVTTSTTPRPGAASSTGDPAMGARARNLAATAASQGPVVVNIGGTGAPHEPPGAINVNPQVPGTERIGIPKHVPARGERIGDLFDPNTIDEVVGHNLAPTVIDWGKLAPGAFRVLKPGGRFQVYFRGAHPGDAKACADALEAAGFTGVDVIGSVLIKATKP